MERLRAVKDSNPKLAIDLAREGNARFPDGVDAPERASILVHALARDGQPSLARGEAETLVERYPDTPWAEEIEQFTGAHPHRDHVIR
jgi:hypothetical protein